jgi:hypothetical protein
MKIQLQFSVKRFNGGVMMDIPAIGINRANRDHYRNVKTLTNVVIAMFVSVFF